MARERLSFGGVTMEVMATADDTGGAMTAIVEVPPLLDTPAHVHANEDELFIALDGEHVITRGEEEITIGPGEAVFAPRGVPHSQRRVVEGEGRIMFVCTPGGLEGFFRELARADSEGRLGPEAYAAASERYGISWL
jgi:mannose-6-phosphate isomerase-like protein (cupin superfamily)